MVTPINALVKFGVPFDNGATPTNENTLFETHHMAMWDVPQDINDAIPVLPNKIYTNKMMVAPLEAGFRNLIKAKLTAEMKTWDGSFNIRPMRGYEAAYIKAVKSGNIDDAIKYLSMHAWAIAFDTNAAWNRLGIAPTLSAGFVKAFTDAGFEWGGSWKRRVDGMHFQLASL
jgi:mRNA-degrading endonuclease HigB of HigAB toxin-antitoxin module